jgi:hypothetical protein
MWYDSIINNIKSRGLKDILNPKKWLNYVNGLIIGVNGINLKEGEILSYSEQLVYRSIKCSQCFEEKACIDCKCPQPLSATVKSHECTLGKYRGMLSPQKWEEFKKQNGIKFKL